MGYNGVRSRSCQLEVGVKVGGAVRKHPWTILLLFIWTSDDEVLFYLFTAALSKRKACISFKFMFNFSDKR